jgi:hypothetical protein
MNKTESLQAVIPETRDTATSRFKVEDGKFCKVLSDQDAERLLLLSAPLQDLSAAGFIPHLLGTEEISNVSVRQIWEVVPGVDLRYAPEQVRHSLDMVIAVAELYIALQTFNLLHSDAGAHNCMWVGEHERFHKVVAIDLDSLKSNTKTADIQVIDFAHTLFEAWVGADVMSIFEGLIFSGKIADFLPQTHTQLLQEKEQGKLNIIKIHPRYASELLQTIFETLELYQKVDNRVLEFVLQAYSATPPSFEDLQRLYQQLQE